MAKVSYLQCDVTGITDESVQSVNIPFPIKGEGMGDGEFAIVNVKLDVASKPLDEVLANVAKAIAPLFTENTTATTRGATSKSKDKDGEDGEDATPEFGSAEHIRQWGRANDWKVGDRGAIPRKLREAFDKAVANGDIVKPDESDDTETDEK